jgi:type IV pilus assembly protein PilV
MRGFTLLEVLIALVIISIGLLGIAAMQASAIVSTHSSQTESLVAIEARSLADAMQANPVYWRGGNYPTTAFTVSAKTGATMATVSDSTLNASGLDCVTTACTPPQLAGYDVQLWGAQLNQQVPGANASITCQATAPTTCTITVFWTQKATVATNSGTQSLATTTNNMSYTLVNQF